MFEPIEKVRALEEQLAQLQRQWPKHSVPPALLQQLDDLEQDLEQALRELDAVQPPHRLDESSLLLGVEVLSRRDPDLARIVEQFGPPPLWDREPGFATLIHFILEQQVSLASANAAFRRLNAAVSPLTPEGFLALDDETLRAVGFSRQKMRYGRHLAQTLLSGILDLDQLQNQTDDEVRAELMQVKGIGRWTADVYLMEVLLRPDIWPTGDLALATAAQRAKNLPARPAPAELETIGEAWRPWRAVAARLLWHDYLSRQ